MLQIDRLKIRTKETDEPLLNELLETAKNVILARRFPFGAQPTELEPRYLDLQVRIALDIYNKQGAEGEKSHTENGVTRTYGAENVSTDLLGEIVPMCGVI